MASTATVPGGWHHHDHNHGQDHGRDQGFNHDKLTGAELAAVERALSKLGSNLGDWGSSTSNKSSSGMVTGHGNDTFAGGMGQSGRLLAGFAKDTTSGGSHTYSSKGGSFHLSNDTINVAGYTASSVKSQDVTHSSHGTYTITLTDTTTIKLTGVDSHSIIKPHGH